MTWSGNGKSGGVNLGTFGPCFEALGYICTLDLYTIGDPLLEADLTVWYADGTTLVHVDASEVVSATIIFEGKAFRNVVSGQQFPDGVRVSFEAGYVPFGTYSGTANVTGKHGFTSCEGWVNSPDHDNMSVDPGPFAKQNPEGKFALSGRPSRLELVDPRPHGDQGKGTEDTTSFFVWGLREETPEAAPTICTAGSNCLAEIQQNGMPLAKPAMQAVVGFLKLDGLRAGADQCYGIQLGEKGPWGPIVCPEADGDPNSWYARFAGGGMSWAEVKDDPDATKRIYGVGWAYTRAAAKKGLLVNREEVAQCLISLGPVNGLNRSSFRQDPVTGLSPRFQDEILGLQPLPYGVTDLPEVPEWVPHTPECDALRALVVAES
jgi:hypothetical protein